MINLASENANGGSFAAYTTAVTGSGTIPVGTYSATSGPDSTPGLTMSCTGTSGGVQANASVPCQGETALLLSCLLKASSASPNLQAILCTFVDGAGNTVSSYAAPAAAVPASTSAIQYQTVVAVPDGAVKAKVSFGNYSWASTGGYSIVLSSPVIGALLATRHRATRPITTRTGPKAGFRTCQLPKS